MSNEKVNHPDHYTALGIEVWDIVRKMNFAEGNAWKYILRAPFKGSPAQDMRKALWYIESESYMPRAYKTSVAVWDAIDKAIESLGSIKNRYAVHAQSVAIKMRYDKKCDGEFHNDLVQCVESAINKIEELSEQENKKQEEPVSNGRPTIDKLLNQYKENGELIDYDNLLLQTIWGMAIWAQNEMLKKDISDKMRRDLRTVRNQAFRVYKGEDSDLCINLAEKPGALKMMASLCIDTGAIVHNNYQDAMFYKAAGTPYKKELAIIAKITSQCDSWFQKQAGKCKMLIDALNGKF